MSGTDNWSVDFAKTKVAQDELKGIAGIIRKEGTDYHKNMQWLLNNWSGPHQEEFERENNCSTKKEEDMVAGRAEALATQLEKLSEKVGDLLADMKKRDEEAANVLLKK